MKSQTFKIGPKFIGEDKRVFIISEIGVNHEGSFKKCVKLFENAKYSGADAVKLQTANPYFNYVKGTKSYKEFQNTDFSGEKTLLSKNTHPGNLWVAYCFIKKFNNLKNLN